MSLRSLSTLVAICLGVVIAPSVCGQPPGGPAPVRLGKVVERRGAVGLPFVGTTRPTRRSIVGSAVAGRVEKIHKEEGDRVKQGDPLIQLRTKTIEIEIAAARAEKKLRQEALNELQNTQPKAIEAAKARLNAAGTLQTYTASKFSRIDTLFRINAAATKEEHDEAMSSKLAAEFAHLAAKATYDLTVSGSQPKIAQAQAQLLIQEQEIARLLDRKEKYIIRAPFTGFTVQKHVEVGDWVKSGDTAIEIVELDPIEIDVSVPERLITQLKRGQEVTVQFDALPEIVVGTVYRVIPEADVRSRSFPVRIRLKNPTQGDMPPPIKAGMLAQVQLPVGKARSALFVPGDALVLNGTRKSVFMVRRSEKGMTVDLVTVDVGIARGKLREVRDRSGRLRRDVDVVVEGNERLRPGQAIRQLK